MEDNSEESILDCLQKNISQKSDFQERDFESQYQDNVYMEKEILQNCNLAHRNFLKVVEFGINRNTNGPYEFGVQFNARYLMNILREYYFRLDCERLNFILNKRIIYFYGHYNQNLKIYTKINSHYINPDLVKILEGHDKEIRVNFDVQNLLKHLELHRFSNKETMKMFFAINQKYRDKSKKREENSNINNIFSELQGPAKQFESEFNFEDEAIPGDIIIETNKFKCKISANFAPLELCSPPKIPSSIFSDYILTINLDIINSSGLKANPLSILDIYCNHYICDFVSNENIESFLTYDNSEGIQFKYENALKFCKACSPDVDESNFYLKMINFDIKKYELDALKIINKKTSVVHFYAGRKEKYYFTKETDQDGNIASAIIISRLEERPLIKDIEKCCSYPENWNTWMEHFKNYLPKECINELEKMRRLHNSNKNNDDLNASTNNKKKKKKKEAKKSSIKSKINSGINIDKNEINDENKENELQGLSVYANDKKGNLKQFNIEIKDVARMENKDEIKIKNNFNPFAIK